MKSDDNVDKDAVDVDLITFSSVIIEKDSDEDDTKETINWRKVLLKKI